MKLNKVIFTAKKARACKTYKISCTLLMRKKNYSDSYRPLPAALIANLQEWFRIELTYNSNALEGNTLTKRETALVVEEGLTIGGKSLKDHLEAINHAYALDYIKELATKKRSQITLTDILNIHRLILKGIDDAHAGAVKKNSRLKISGSDATLPDPLKVPELMQDFMQWLQTTHEDPRIVAALAAL